MSTRLRLINVVCLACCLIVAAAVRVADFIASAFVSIARSTAAFVWSTIEPALRSSSPLAYVGPSSIHALRHEAGTSRRAADRHI